MMKFKVNHKHFSSTMCAMNKFREDSSLCDIKLMIGNQTLQAHRCVLAAGSPYFNTLFLGQFIEASMKEINLSEVTNSITALENVVTFIYTGEIDIDEDNIGIIIKLSSFFLIDSLRKFCCTFMMDNFALATCLKYYLYSIDHDLFIVGKNVEPMVRSRFHDFLIYEENTLDISTDEMKHLVEWDILQHCSTVSIVRFVVLWVNKWLTECHVLIAKSIFDDLVLRENSPEVGPLQLTGELSEFSLYTMIESSLSLKCTSRTIFLNSLKQVFQKIRSETNSENNYSGNEMVIITVSPSYKNLCVLTGDNEIELSIEEPILYVSAYIPRTRCWYQLKQIYKDESDFASLNVDNYILMLAVFHEELLFINFAEEKILVKDLNTLENNDFKKLEYSDFLDDEAHQPGMAQYARDICVAAGKHSSRYLVSKVRRFNNSNRERFVGSYFSGYKLHEDGKTWEKRFQTEFFDAPDEECEADSSMNMYAKISSVSNEMMVVHSADELNIVFVVDLNQENAIPVTLLSDVIDETYEMIIGEGTKIVEANDAMYIVTDGTTVESSYNGKANVRYEYKLNSLRLIEIHSTVANLGQLNETFDHSNTSSYEGVLSPCLSEMSASMGDGLWYMEGNMDKASFLTKVSIDDDRNPVIEDHTPPPFPSITAMFPIRINSKILENKKLVTRFFGKE